MQAVIMAGGKGTRLAEITKNIIPKPMVPVCGKPLLEWQIEKLKEYGVDHVTMIVGFLGDVIREHFGDGSAFGIKIDYITEEEPLGTAGALYYYRAMLEEDDFLLIFGDIFFDFDIRRMLYYHSLRHAAVTLMAHPNIHPYDSDLIRTDEDGRVTGFDSKHNKRDYWYDNCVNAGIYVMNRSVLSKLHKVKKRDLEKELLAGMVKKNEAVYAYRTPEFVRDVGTVDRIRKTEADIVSGLTAAKNLNNRQKAIFLDRDGTLNVYQGFIRREEDFELEKGVCHALQKINSSGYLAVCVTNQPVIARGELSFSGLENIHNKMKTLLGREGAYLDDVLFCPHHPDGGYEGEVPELKVRCRCRKPEPGMLEEAADKFNIDLASSWIIGDGTIDMETGRRAGVKTVLVKTGLKGEDGRFSAAADLEAEDLESAVDMILARDREQE